MKPDRWPFGKAVFAMGLVASMIGAGMIVASAQVLGPGEQIRICHSDPPDAFIYHGSETPAIDSIVKGEGHDLHTADIIPPFDYAGIAGDIYHGHYPGKNWDAAGMAIWNHDCEGGVGTQTMTTVFNAATNAALVGALPNGGSVYDTAHVTPAGTALMGTVSFSFFANGTCSGTGMPAGSAPVNTSHSLTKGPLTTPGSYAFMAVFTDGENFNTSTSACEPFTVAAPPRTDTTTVTTVFNAATNVPLTGTLPANGSVYDRATVTPKTGGGTPTGSITYTFFQNGDCSGTGSPAGSGSQSTTQSNLVAGSYSFQATYGGDSNFNGSTSSCEAFTVEKANTTVSTTVFDAEINAPLINNTLAENGSAYDMATVTPSTGSGTPSGTVTYTFFLNGDCSGTGSPAGMVPVGTQSSTQGPLTPGTYSFQATYNGDEHFNGSTSGCEVFSVRETPKTETTLTTTIHDAASNQVVTTLPAGGSVYDLATVHHTGSGTPTGTIAYTFFHNTECEDGSGAGTVPVGSKSSTEGPLAVGSYSFKAVYSGDSNFKGSTSDCEPLTVTKAETTLTTVVFDNSTGQPLSGSLAAGGSVYDLATVNHAGGLTPGGTVTYTFFNSNVCEEGTFAGTVPLGSKSNTEGPLSPGSYSFEAVYSGDSNFKGSTSTCEHFTVAKAATTVTTVVFDNSTNQPLNNMTVAEGGSVYDLATVQHPDGGSPSGNVTYTFFHNNQCSGDGTSAGTVPVGTKSNTEGPLTPGSYSFTAVYHGDSNFAGSSSGCEPFTVIAAGQTTVTTVVFDASTNQPMTNATMAAGGSVYDLATVNHTGQSTPTGTITYTFFLNGNCSGTGSSAGTVAVGTKSSTQASLAAGSYSFKAVYSGDQNFKGSTSGCEPFTVTAAAGGAPGETPTPTPEGGVPLAETGFIPPGLGAGAALMLLGLAGMIGGALIRRRQRA